MYKSKNTNLLIPAILLLSMQTANVNAFSLRDSFRDMFDDLDHSFKNMHQEFKTRFHKQEQLSPEDEAVVNKQLELVAKIKPEITKNENGIVTIALPIEDLDKDKIELSLEHGLLIGHMPLENGYFKFSIHPQFIRCEYLIEISKEISQETTNNNTNVPTKDMSNESKDKEKVAYSHKIGWRTSNYFTEKLPLEVDLSKTQSETKNNTLFIRLEPKSYTRLKIRHS